MLERRVHDPRTLAAWAAALPPGGRDSRLGATLRRSRLAFGATIRESRIAGVALLVALAPWPFGAAAAEAYKCVVRGATTYQDYPCGSAGSVFRTWPADDRNAASAETRPKAAVAATDRGGERESAAQIEGIEREIRGYEQAEQGELAALRARQDYANYNLPGAVWERTWVMDAIAKEMQSVSEKYAAKKQAARDRMAALRKAREKGEAAR